jgi:hypothetical protein
MMPDLKNRCGRNDPKNASAQSRPNRGEQTRHPMRNRMTRVQTPQSALENRAANSFMPKTFIESTWSHRKSGGF